jgi:hypothetical protein
MELILGDAEAPPAERGDAPGARQQVSLHQNVVGDRDDVELPRPPVEINRVAQAEAPVAPAGVHVEVAEQEWLVSRHD